MNDEFRDGRARLRDPPFGYHPLDPWQEAYRRAYPGPPIFYSEYHNQVAAHAHYRGGPGGLPPAPYACNLISSGRREYGHAREEPSRASESAERRDRSSEKRHKHKSSKHRHKRSKHREERSRKSKRPSPNDDGSSDDNPVPTLDHSGLTPGAGVRGRGLHRGGGHSSGTGSELVRKSKKRQRSRASSHERSAKRLTCKSPSHQSSSSSLSPNGRKRQLTSHDSLSNSGSPSRSVSTFSIIYCSINIETAHYMSFLSGVGLQTIEMDFIFLLIISLINSECLKTEGGYRMIYFPCTESWGKSKR